MDNFSAHQAAFDFIESIIERKLKNIRVIFLPPNVTSLYQLLDQGIISAFKAHWKRYWLEYILEKVEGSSDPVVDIDVLKATRQAMKSQHQHITQQTFEYYQLKSSLLGPVYGPLNRPFDSVFTALSIAPPASNDITEYETIRAQVKSLLRNVAREIALQIPPDVDDFIQPHNERVIDEEGDLEDLICEAYDENIPDLDKDSPEDDTELTTTEAALDAYKVLITYTEQHGDASDRDQLLRLNRQIKLLKIKTAPKLEKQTSIAGFFKAVNPQREAISPAE